MTCSSNYWHVVPCDRQQRMQFIDYRYLGGRNHGIVSVRVMTSREKYANVSVFHAKRKTQRVNTMVMQYHMTSTMSTSTTGSLLQYV